MASNSGWFDKWTKRITEELLRNRQAGDVQSQPDSALLKFINAERTKATLPDGTIVDVILRGNVIGKYAVGLRIGNRKYVAYKKWRKPVYVDGAGFKPYVLLVSFPSFPTILIFDVKKNLWAEVELPADFTENLNVNTMSADFTPSGKHLIVWGYYMTGDEDQQLVQNVQANWIYFRNFSVVEDPDNIDPLSTEGMFEFEGKPTITINSGSLTSGMAQPPSAPTANWTAATFDNQAGATTHIEFENDPAFSTELAGAFYIGNAPTDSSNPLDTSVFSIRPTYYEYSDENGVTQPALDLVGNLTLTNEKVYYKRVLEIEGNYPVLPVLPHVVHAAYAGGGTSDFWRDPGRLTGRTTTLTTDSVGFGPTVYLLLKKIKTFTTPYTVGSDSNIWAPELLLGGGVGAGGTENIDASDSAATTAKIGSGVTTVSVTTHYTNGSGPATVVSTASNVRFQSRANVYETIFFLQTHNGTYGSLITKQTIVDADGNETVTGRPVEFTVNTSQTTFRSKSDPVTEIDTARIVANVGEIGSQRAHLIPEYLNIPGTDVQNLYGSALGEVIFSNIFTKDAGVTTLLDVGHIVVTNSLNVITVTIVTEVTGDVDAGNTLYKWKFQKWSYNPATTVANFLPGVSQTFLIPTKWTELFPPVIWQSQVPQIFILRG